LRFEELLHGRFDADEAGGHLELVLDDQVRADTFAIVW
jgi:hypothetical protein